MTANSKQRIYTMTGRVAVVLCAALFSLPFVLVAIFLIERVFGAG